MIELREISVKFGDKTVFDHYSCELPDRGIIVVTGESGIGKTTFLRLLAGLQKADAGIVVGTQDRKISFVFQEPRLLEWKTAFENIESVSDQTIATALLQQLDMRLESDRKCSLLSGGQKQRVAIARAFAYSSDLVLLDEPFTGLDEENKYRVVTMIKTAKLAIIVTHDLSDAELLNADRIIHLP